MVPSLRLTLKTLPVLSKEAELSLPTDCGVSVTSDAHSARRFGGITLITSLAPSVSQEVIAVVSLEVSAELPTIPTISSI
jgi:hypothetical protein